MSLQIASASASHKPAAKDLLEQLTDYQVASDTLVILIVRILTALLSLAAAPGHHGAMILRLVRHIHSTPMASRVNMLEYL